MMSKEEMYIKFDNLDDIKLSTNLLLIQGLTKKWLDKRPDNEDLLKLKDAIVDVTLVVNKLQLDRGNYHIAMTDYRTRSLRSIERARKAEEKVEALEKELKIYKKKQELGL